MRLMIIQNYQYRVFYSGRCGVLFNVFDHFIENFLSHPTRTTCKTLAASWCSINKVIFKIYSRIHDYTYTGGIALPDAVIIPHNVTICPRSAETHWPTRLAPVGATTLGVCRTVVIPDSSTFSIRLSGNLYLSIMLFNLL